jgi:erythromycin esterase-like protein
MSDATIIREAVQPLTGSAQDYDSLLALIGDARFVLLGEASHGTHEFLRRARGDHEAAYCGARLHCCRD